MSSIIRASSAVWHGDLRTGNGLASTDTGHITDLPVTFASRFEDGSGSNPEELLAAAHAACFSMALAGRLAREGTPPTSIFTRAAVHLDKRDAGFRVTAVHLTTKGTVPGIDAEAFKAAAEATKSACPISALLMPGLESLSLEASLE